MPEIGGEVIGGGRFKKSSAAMARRAADVLVVCTSTFPCGMPNGAWGSAIDFKQAGAALAAADAHGHDGPLGLAPTALLQNVARQPRAGHPERVADGDRAAVDVVLVGIDAKLVTGIEALAGKRLVELPKIDIVDFQAMALQQLRHRENRADAHLVRLAARPRPGDQAADRLAARCFPAPGLHQT